MSLSIRITIFRHRLQYSHNPTLKAIGSAWYRAQRWLQGARRVRLGRDRNSGAISSRGLRIKFGGACPVQGEGIVDGRACYYRSRGEGWQFHVAPPGSDDVFADDAWVYSERPYYFPDGGWVDPAVSIACIKRAVAKFRGQA